MSRTSLRLRVLPRFPVDISGDNAISVVRDNLDIVVKNDFDSMIRIPAVDNPDKVFILTWNADLDLYSIMSFTDTFAAAIVVADVMTTTVYDPTNKAQDIFAYTDAAKAAALLAASNAQATANAALPKAGGTMSGAIAMGSNKITGLAAGTVSGDAVNFAQLSAIRVPTTVDNTIPRFDGTTGALQTSGVVVDDSNNVSGVNNLIINGGFKAGDAAFVTDAAIESAVNSGIAAGFEYKGGTGGSAMGANRTSSDGNLLVCYRAGTQVGSVSVTASATAFNTSSDYRIKENIKDFSDGLTKVLSLRPRTFNVVWDESNFEHTGYIAHEVQEVFPEAITGDKDAVDSDGKIIVQQLDMSKLSPLHTSAIQQLYSMVVDLQSQLNALKGN